MAVKAIIFDCFGVLVEDSMNKFYDTHLSDQPEKVAEIQHLDHLSTAGKITWDELLDEIARISSVNRSQAKSELDINPQNLELFAYIEKALKPKYKIGFLSNAADDWLEELFTKDQLDLFDDFVLSFQHEINKPNPEIFALAAERLGVAPDECVMIDDVESYCRGAESAGMRSIQYTGTRDVARRLKNILDE